MKENIKWTKLTDTKSFETQPQQLIKVRRDEILIIKDDNNYHALNNRCPHMGLSLNASKCNMKDKTIHCKFHSSSFSYKTGVVNDWLNVKGFEKLMIWLYSKFDKDAKEMMSMEPTKAEVFKTKVEEEYVWVGIED
jgi:nitrite reductase/ring-hydroxylating ferredoxin subunit